jgi:predicted nucleotide-binding protein
MIQAPTPRKPRVFIASTMKAAEDGAIAPAVKRLLGDAVVAEVWNENMIRAAADRAPRTRGEVMANLYKAARYYDFVIVLLGRSSAAETARADGLQPVRDNLLFEMGLFMGGLGAKRTLVALEPGLTKAELALPSDLFGDAFGHPPVELLSDEEAVLRRQVGIIRDAILETDAKTGLSLLPSTGTAIGYFKNFIQPVAEYLLSDEFRIDDQIYHARETGYVFDIVMPASLTGAGFGQRAAFVKRNAAELEERKVAFGSGRPYPFFVRKGSPSGRLHLVDFPTPLAASVEVINLIIDDEMKSLDEIDYTHGNMKPKQLLEAKELSNFELTLYKLLTQQLTKKDAEPASREFPNHVRLRRLNEDLSIKWD